MGIGWRGKGDEKKKTQFRGNRRRERRMSMGGEKKREKKRWMKKKMKFRGGWGCREVIKVIKTKKEDI